ncbi:SRPBCC family protein [Ideonella sp. BN130291]|uniref:SRPBCC family protein n=1 Tax=Ideonella sp. BN130291 TaxID=3112940 RepID=UPI002E265546|nr:SRPBCC family protein [Ideonella sp. BN130291]
MAHGSDRIEKQILLKAPRSRVWRALTDARQFGEWFKVKLDQDFAAGQRVTGKMTYPGYEGFPFEATVDRVEPEVVFSFRWEPGAEPGTTGGVATLVEFRLEDAPGGTLLTLVESGFDRLPAHLRDKAFRGNDEGWSLQTQNIKAYVEA